MGQPKKTYTLEQTLTIVLKKSQEKVLSIKEILEILAGKGRFFIILLLCIPFCQPIQIPGFSTPFGVLITLLGLRITFGHRVWLPKTILAKRVPSPLLKKMLTKGLWLVKKMKRLTHPRLVWICHHPVAQMINGLLITLLGFFLALPIPIPLTNLLAAWPIFLICLGMLEDDGVFIFAGYAIIAGSLMLGHLLFAELRGFHF